MIWILAAALFIGGLYLAWRLIGTTGQHAEPLFWHQRDLPPVRWDRVDRLAARYHMPAPLLDELLQTEHRIQTIDQHLRSIGL